MLDKSHLKKEALIDEKMILMKSTKNILQIKLLNNRVGVLNAEFLFVKFIVL